MSAAPAEGKGPGSEALVRGLAAFAARDLDGAHAAFERSHRADPREPRAMSWYGVTLVIVERNSSLGVLLCDQALRSAGPDPELLLNAARVHVALNQRERAVRHVKRGLELWPGEPALAAARLSLGRRSTPVLPFLPRGNPMNVLLGKLRHRWRKRRAPVLELSAVSLGDAVPPQAAEPPRS